MILIFDVYGVAYVGAGLNSELLQAVQSLRAKGVKVCFGSNMASGQKTMFWNVLGLKRFGDDLYCSGDLGVAKPAPAFYSRVEAALGVSGDSILFFDDSAANVAAANAAGWNGYLYTDVATTLDIIGKHNGI